MRRNSEPCLRKTLPALCCGLIPTPSLVMMALVWGGTLNSSAANFSTAVKGAASGTLKTLKGSFGSEVRVTLKETFPPAIEWMIDPSLCLMIFRSLFSIYVETKRERERERGLRQ
eukprot:TRINITY_DN6518_c0_g1_i1.p1 TRINITY_DN6518_c0_g1~~TRINITY_DN6518_c0_g1_i1.p1  ORF type:complete len:115 (-),score=25.23 TRINITY_DN6518_c0_g1_i1:123-467(-)